MNTPKGPSTTFSEPEAQRILARAAELEASGVTRFTTEDLQQIAAKAGIDSHALERAIIEATVSSNAPRSGEPEMLAPGRMAVLIGSGAILGALAMATDNITGGADVAVLGPSALYTVYLAIRHPLAEGIPGLLRKLGTAFGAFTLTIVGLAGVQDASPAVTWSLMCGALGVAVQVMRAGTRVFSPGGEPSPADSR